MSQEPQVKILADKIMKKGDVPAFKSYEILFSQVYGQQSCFDALQLCISLSNADFKKKTDRFRRK